MSEICNNFNWSNTKKKHIPELVQLQKNASPNVSIYSMIKKEIRARWSKQYTFSFRSKQCM